MAVAPTATAAERPDPLEIYEETFEHGRRTLDFGNATFVWTRNVIDDTYTWTIGLVIPAMVATEALAGPFVSQGDEVFHVGSDAGYCLFGRTILDLVVDIPCTSRLGERLPSYVVLRPSEVVAEGAAFGGYVAGFPAQVADGAPSQIFRTATASAELEREATEYASGWLG